MRTITNFKVSQYITQLIILTFLAGLLLTPSAVNATEAASYAAGLPGSINWQKTFDRHEIQSAAYGGRAYVAVGADGIVKVSEDGEEWTVADSKGVLLNHVVWGGDKFVAAGSQGRIIISTDGRTWTDAESGTDQNLKAVVWSGKEYVAVGDRGTLLKSEDGIDWNKVSLDREYSFSGVTYGNGKYILTTSDTFNFIFVSNDGENWVAVEPYGDHYGYYNIAYNGETFLMYGKIPHQEGYAALTSEDGENWTAEENAPDAGSIAVLDGSFVAVGDSFRDGNSILTQNIYFSGSGMNWQPHQVKWDSGFYSDLKSVHSYSYGDKLIGINYRGEICTSTDGLNWVRQKSELNDDFDKISWDGGQLVAYDKNGNLKVSEDGTSWIDTEISMHQALPIHDLFYFNNGTIIINAGSPERMFISEDGANWTDRQMNGLRNARILNSGNQYLLIAEDRVYASADTRTWDLLDMNPQELNSKSVAFDGSTYVSVGGQAAIYGGEGNHSDSYRVIGTSSDFRNWSIQKDDKTADLTSVIYAGGQFVAVGADGTILTSRDGLSGWNRAVTDTTNDLFTVIWDGNRYLAAGEEGTILCSYDGINWVKEKAITGDTINRIVIDNGHYLAIGQNTILKGTIKHSEEGQKSQFEDIKGHWAKQYIDELAERKLVNGVDARNFNPDRNITRAEFSAIITRALNLKSSSTEKNRFRDIKTTDWYYESIIAAYENGILNGYGEGTMRPGREITREEAMAMIARAIRLQNFDMDLSDLEIATALAGFKDRNDISPWAKTSAVICVKNGIFEGSNGYLEPVDEITRAETAATIFRMLGLY